MMTPPPGNLQPEQPFAGNIQDEKIADFDLLDVVKNSTKRWLFKDEWSLLFDNAHKFPKVDGASIPPELPGLFRIEQFPFKDQNEWFKGVMVRLDKYNSMGEHIQFEIGAAVEYSTELIEYYESDLDEFDGVSDKDEIDVAEYDGGEYDKPYKECVRVFGRMVASWRGKVLVHYLDEKVKRIDYEKEGEEDTDRIRSLIRDIESNRGLESKFRTK